MSKILVIILLFTACCETFAQSKFSGKVVEFLNSKEVPIPGVSVYWMQGQNGTFTDSTGNFSLNNSSSLPTYLVISFIGYRNDTISVTSSEPVKIVLKKVIDIKEVEVTARKEALAISTINPMNSEKITQRELMKAACCNLSEAFETNPSVSVSYKDAVTGVKEIQLLGLGGTYVQLLSENTPDMRGLAGIYGLTFIPGPWIESIQLTKGSGSVVNGYESSTGQINVEYKKPHDIEQPRFFLNLFADELGGIEANAILKNELNEKWSTMLMLHGRIMKNEVDRNKDGFMDIPDNNALNIYNRWQFQNNRNLESQIILKFLSDEIEGGQTKESRANPMYKTDVKTRRLEVGGKLGIVFPEKPLKSIGNIFQFTLHDMTSAFGLKNYNANESSVYFQSIYQNTLWKVNHQYKTGITYRYNVLEQRLAGLPVEIEEHIPGIFLEYTYSYLDKFTLIAGMREDLQEKKNLIFTPRLHGKYNFSERFIFRFSGGKSYRRPYLIADHISVLASSRQLEFREKINPEIAWNYGINLTKKFDFLSREFTLSADAYRTEFVNQLIVDTYTDSTKISFYNLNGDSYSNSMQVTLNAELMELLNVRVSYKLDDVRSTFNGSTEQQPLVSRKRALGTVSYSTDSEHWKFDYTIVWEGEKKLQNIYIDSDNNVKDFSPSFTVTNFQVTKVFRKFELYSGVENLFDFRQSDPIINPENPFGNSFDATNIWGPIAGRRIYAGLRFAIK